MKANPTYVPRSISLKAPALLTSSSAYMDYCKLGEGVAKAAFVGPKRDLEPDQSSSDDTQQKKLDDRDDACGKGKTKKQANLENRVLLSTYCEPFDSSQPFQDYYCCDNTEKLSECDASVECAFTLGELNAYNSYDVLTAFPCRHHFKTEGFQSSDLTTITNPFDKLEKTTCPMCRKEVEYYYTGPLLFGKPHTLDDGLFGIQWPKYGIIYEGEFKMGQRNGRGTMKFPSGQVYKGEFKNGKKHGQGKMTYSNGDVYEGGFKNGKRHGQGKQTHPDGDVYTGEWKDGEMNGQGMYTWPVGQVYEGGFKHGNFHGQGTMTYSNGDVYTGEWKNNKKNGQGKMTFSNGDVYTGTWKNGEKNGQGEYKWATGDVYDGEWLNNRYTEPEKLKQVVKIEKKEEE